MACFVIQSANAQCGSGPRYTDSIFASYTISTVTYSTVYNLQMDVYQPVGDTQSLRPVLVLAHGGSFTGGDRTADNVITQLCSDFAHKGYVTVSIDYRLTSNGNLLIADSAIAEVLEAVGDGKAAVRYLYKDVLTNGNTFKIDTNNIFIGGNSAGAVLFDQYAYVTGLNELNTQFQQIIANNLGGTLDGISGNPGYSSNFKGVINLAGALNIPEWIENCSKPIVSAQGDQDPVVPYKCGNPEYGLVPVTLCGLDSMQPYITATTSYWSSMVFPGAGHVPWQTNNTDFYMIDTMITTFLNHALCMPYIPQCVPVNTGIKQISSGPSITLYPNPASNVLNIQSSQFINDISLSDETGRLVSQVNGINTLSYELNTSRLSPGVYLVRINDSEGLVPSIRKIVIE
jgi:hypothetical protein